MKKALEYIVTSIVDDKKAVVIDESEEEGIINFGISVATEDIGKIIGKDGKIIRSIRTAMRIPAMKENKRIHITINDQQQQ